MVTISGGPFPPDLADVAAAARARYAQRLAGGAYVPWWTAVIITASSARQAERYAEEMRRRRESGRVPDNVLYLAVPDLDDERIGSGGATINALRALLAAQPPAADCPSLEAWWAGQRVLIVHSGGDSRRLPQYSLSGKLFSALPVKTPWGEVSTVFDETLALSTAWAGQLQAGLVVASGDVIITLDAADLHWERPGVCGVGLRESVEVGSRHGVFVADEQGRVYSFLQKPTAAQVRAAGGLLTDNTVALDSGIFRFDPAIAARLTTLSGVSRTGDGWAADAGILTRSNGRLPDLDIYEHFSMALTGEWMPAADAPPAHRALAAALHGVPFWCDLARGEFTHVGSTVLFRQLMTEETNFSRLYAAQQRLGVVTPAGVHSAGVIIDSMLAPGSVLGVGAVAIECDLGLPVNAGAGAILHGLDDLPERIDVPEDTVLHQVPCLLPDGRRGIVLRVYGVADDPKAGVARGTATWFGRPMPEMLAMLGLTEDDVWPDTPLPERSLWNAKLFPLDNIAGAWACARWLLGQPSSYSAETWRVATRLSLADSARWADTRALGDARTRRLQSNWQQAAVALVTAGSDIRPLLAAPPGVTALANVARELTSRATALTADTPTEAASHYFQAGRFYTHAGLDGEAEGARAAAFACVQQGVDQGTPAGTLLLDTPRWQQARVTVSAPARVDLGGGWSDTPPFCLDWGGTVLNIAMAINGVYPISTTVRRVPALMICCISGDSGDSEVYTSTEDVLAKPEPGCPFSIPRVALQMLNLFAPGQRLADVLLGMGGGLEIRTSVDLPMGSGLGTSSILAATVLRALAAMLGVTLTDEALSDQVMRLEQQMTTGGGWQDQAGGIFPGAKLLTTGPGLRQRLRVQPVGWSPEREAEFTDRFVLYYTGIRRIAKNLLAQVVGSYLAREVATVQVLHSIKTLAMEMAYAMREGEWPYLGELLDRHWRLNQVLDPHTTNAPINAMLEAVRPYLAGAKLAGAGGGGFLMLLAKDPAAAQQLRARLADPLLPGMLYDYTIAEEGLRVEGA